MASQMPEHSTIFQKFVQADNKENIKPDITGPLWGESTGDRWISLAKDK